MDIKQDSKKVLVVKNGAETRTIIQMDKDVFIILNDNYNPARQSIDPHYSVYTFTGSPMNSFSGLEHVLYFLEQSNIKLSDSDIAHLTMDLNWKRRSIMMPDSFIEEERDEFYTD